MMKLISIIALGLFSASPALALDKDDLKEVASFFTEDSELKNTLMGQWYESTKTCGKYIESYNLDTGDFTTVSSTEPKIEEVTGEEGGTDGADESSGEKSMVSKEIPSSYDLTCSDLVIELEKIILQSGNSEKVESCEIASIKAEVQKDSNDGSHTTEPVTTDDSLENIFQAIYNQGTNDCYCCSNPSMCLTGGFSVVTAILRNVGMVGTGAAFFSGDKSIQKHCDELKKVQTAAGSFDAMAATTCTTKAKQCHRQFEACGGSDGKIQKIIERLSNTSSYLSSLAETVQDKINQIDLLEKQKTRLEDNEKALAEQKAAFTQSGYATARIESELTSTKSDLAEVSRNIESKINDILRFTGISHHQSGNINFLMEVKKDLEYGATICENKIKELEVWQTKFVSSKEQRCGAITKASRKQWAQSVGSFAGAAISDKCAGDYKDDQQIAVAPCNNQSLSNNPQACQAHCLTSPEDPQCVNFCKQYPGDRVCQGVCSNQSPGHNYAFCTTVQNCVTNPDGENCDQVSVRETASYDEDERTTLNLNSLDNTPRAGSECDDPLECDLDLDGFVEEPKAKAKSTGSMQYGGGGGGSAGGGGGGGLGGGTGGGVAQGAEDAEVDGQNEEYKNILAGLSPKDNSGSRSGRSFSYRGSGSNSDKDRGFDLSKFLPKNKKKKAASVRRSRKIAGPEDNIFTALSSTVRVYCGDNQLQCN